VSTSLGTGAMLNITLGVCEREYENQMGLRSWNSREPAKDCQGIQREQKTPGQLVDICLVEYLVANKLSC